MRELYDSVEAFYAADECRRRSPEWDYGVWWSDDLGRMYRISHVRDTGEVIAVFRGAPVVGEVAPGIRVMSTGGDGAVEVLGRWELPEVEALFDGWADVCMTPNSLTWVRERVRRSSGAE